MVLLKGKKYLTMVIINILIIFGVALLVTQYLDYRTGNKRLIIEKNLIEQIHRHEDKTGVNIYEKLKNEENETVLNETLTKLNDEKYGFINVRGQLFSLRLVYILCIVTFVFLILQLINFMFIKRTQKKYIKKIDKFIDSLQNKKFDYQLREEDDSVISSLNSRFNKLGLSIKSNYDSLEKEKEKLKDTLVDISHQIKTPLASLMMNNEIIMDSNNLEKNQIEFLNLSQSQIIRLSWLVSSLLKIARFDANSIQIKEEYFKISNLSLGFEEVLYEQLNKKNLKLIHTGDLDTKVKLDLNWTREALLNIVKNATEHAFEGTNININYLVNVSMIRIEISNIGENISNEDITNIFKRFYKSSRNTNKESVGVGLNLSKKIVEAQLGTISVQNDNNGVTFTMLFLK
ncbi:MULTISPECIES: sensor histidine kinase [Helcococcus]|uniref:histidine kinase n=1 Tax=Helcococcus bovis TaxID=3153252 RepID=A0ABW9F4M5_9FIRM